MKYEKLTLEKFLENLGANNYEGIAGARRAVGKADWPQTHKNKAKIAVDAHFGVSEGAPKAAKKNTPKADKPKQRASSKIAATSPKEKAEKAQKPAKAEKPIKVSPPAGAKRGPGRPRKAVAAPVEQAAPPAQVAAHLQIQTCRHVIEAASAALTALRGNSAAGPDDLQRAVDLTNSSIRKIAALAGDIQLFQGTEISAVTEAPVEETQEGEAPQQLPLFKNPFNSAAVS